MISHNPMHVNSFFHQKFTFNTLFIDKSSYIVYMHLFASPNLKACTKKLAKTVDIQLTIPLYNTLQKD